MSTCDNASSIAPPSWGSACAAVQAILLQLYRRTGLEEESGHYRRGQPARISCTTVDQCRAQRDRGRKLACFDYAKTSNHLTLVA